jgi:hypothetical protein
LIFDPTKQLEFSLLREEKKRLLLFVFLFVIEHRKRSRTKTSFCLLAFFLAPVRSQFVRALTPVGTV